MNRNETVRTEIIGHCGVDSGTLMVIDPCYVLKDERDESKPFDQQSEYMRTVMPTCEAPWHAPVLLDDYRPDQEMGVVFSTLDGDGEYPIVAEYNSAGRIVRVIIDFTYDAWAEDEEDDEDLWMDTCDECGTDITNGPSFDSQFDINKTLCQSCKDAEEPYDHDEDEDEDEDES